MKEELLLICTNCFWEGKQDELVSLTDDVDDIAFDFCPSCEEKDFEEFYEDVEEL